MKPGAKTVEEQLGLLRELTRTTGQLHQAQVTQLKIWPLLAVGGSTRSEFTWDPESKVITFDVKAPRKPKGAKADRVLEAFHGSVAFLLGEEWKVVLKLNGEAFKEWAAKKPRKKQCKHLRKDGTSAIKAEPGAYPYCTLCEQRV